MKAPNLMPIEPVSDEAALLRTIMEHPDDDAARLVYADWLEERGDANNVTRAELIRRQIADTTNTTTVNFKLTIGPPRGSQVLRPAPAFVIERVRSLVSLMADILPCSGVYGIRRGFIETAVMDWEAWRDHGDVLCRLTPLCDVELTTWPDAIVQAGKVREAYRFILAERGRVITIEEGTTEGPNDPFEFHRWATERLLGAEWHGIRFMVRPTLRPQ
jgi:uncharacterized protein (TIGR02996 family)